MKLIELNIQSIIALCRKHKVKELFAFGSILTDKFNEDSDVDLLVRFDGVSHNEYADNYFDLYHAFRALFGREVDLVEYEALSNPYFIKEIEQTKRLIYG